MAAGDGAGAGAAEWARSGASVQVAPQPSYSPPRGTFPQPRAYDAPQAYSSQVFAPQYHQAFYAPPPPAAGFPVGMMASAPTSSGGYYVPAAPPKQPY